MDIFPVGCDKAWGQNKNGSFLHFPEGQSLCARAEGSMFAGQFKFADGSYTWKLLMGNRFFHVMTIRNN